MMTRTTHVGAHMTFFDDFSKGARDANSPGAPQFARSAGELAARNLNGGAGGGGAGIGLGGGGGVVGLFAVVALVFACVYTVVVGALAVPGSLILMLLASAPAPGVRRKGRYFQAYVASFQGLFAYAWTGTVLFYLAYLTSRQFPPLTAAVPPAFDRDLVVYAGLALWQPLGLLVATRVTSKRLAKNFREAGGFARALIASLVPISIACGAAVLAWSVVKDGGKALSVQDLSDAAAPYLVMAMFLLVGSGLCAFAGALAIKFFNLIDGHGKHSFGQAFLAVLLCVCAFSGLLLSALFFADLKPVLVLLPKALRAADGIPEALVQPAIYLLVLLTVATLASTTLLSFKLGRSYQSAFGVFKSAVIATSSGAFSFVVVCLVAAYAQAQAQLHYFPSAAPSAASGSAASGSAAGAVPIAAKTRAATTPQLVAKRPPQLPH
jgi:hypothetical protein